MSAVFGHRYFVDADFLPLFYSGVYMGSSPENLPQKEIRLSAEN
jgi:hypothetical protein